MSASIVRSPERTEPNDDEALRAAAAELHISNLSIHVEHGRRVVTGTARYQVDRDLFFEAVKQLDGWEIDVLVDLAVERHDIRGYHTVQPGETLATIAERYLGDASHERKVFEANRDRMNDPDQIFPGQQLVIP